MKQLTGRTAIVTGASRGIGPYICRALANEGMNIVLAARSAPEMEALAASLNGSGTKTLVVVTDVSDTVACETLVARATAEFGAVDLLVNNAGIELTLAYVELPLEKLDTLTRVNLIGPMQLARLVLPGMLARRRGHIVNIASLAGKAPVPFGVPYAASKAGLIAFSQSLQVELTGSGVGVSAISPGFVSDAGLYHDGMAKTGARASKMMGTSKPEKVAAAVVRAVKENKIDLIVNPTPIRPLLALAEVAPGLTARLLRMFGIQKTMGRIAAANRREAAPLDDRPGK